jgi:hypothetical protein
LQWFSTDHNFSYFYKFLTQQQLVESRQIATVAHLEAKLDLLIANALAYNEDGCFEQQQAKKLSTLIKKEIPRAAAAEARHHQLVGGAWN